MPVIEVAGATTKFIEQGNSGGEAMVLVHGGATSSSHWREVTPFLAERFRLLLPDLHGCGGTAGWHAGSAMTFDDEADLVIGVIEHACRRPVHLVGHSYGGGVSLRLVVRRPDLVRTLSLFEPSGYQLLAPAGHPELLEEFESVRDHFLATVGRGALEQGWEPYFDYYHGEEGRWRTLPDNVREAILDKTQVLRHVYDAQRQNATTFGELESIAAPAIVARGEHTTAPELTVAAIVARHIAGARLVDVLGARHMLQATHPKQVAELVITNVDGKAALPAGCAAAA